MRMAAKHVSIVCLAAVVFFSVASVALADTQTTTPGVTERVIWGTVQVAAYKVNVSHIGNLHAEVAFDPDWADFDIYIYDEACRSVWEEPMGYSAMLLGKEVIDHYVSQGDFDSAPGSTEVIAEDPLTGEPEHLRGIDFYVVIVAFNETARFKVWGYAPYTDTSAGVTVSDRWNWRSGTFRFLGTRSGWGTLKGAPYGSWWAFTPTSEGEGQIRLQWPATKVDDHWMVTYDATNAPCPANMETYLYAGASWGTVFDEKGYDWYAPQAQDSGQWYGHKNTWTISESGDFRPGVKYHYVPSLVGVVNDATLGPGSGPKEGISTIGYKATMFFPQNLRITSSSSRVVLGNKATVRGTFALDGAWQEGAKVSLQMQDPVKKTWQTVKSVTTTSGGKWTVQFAPKRTTWFRVMAAGNDGTGLPTEYSGSRAVRVV